MSKREILLITAGIEDSWDPTDAELQALASMFMQACEDPEGAVVAVRHGVTVERIPLPGKPRKGKWKPVDAWKSADVVVKKAKKTR